MNTCTLCLEEKTLSEFETNLSMRKGVVNQCRKCKYERRASDPEQLAKKYAAHRRWKLKTLYGITEVEYEKMFVAQSGLCAICDNPEKHGKRLAVDHNHTTGAVRQLLCGGCNIMLGGAADNIETMQKGIEYLLRHMAREGELI